MFSEDVGAGGRVEASVSRKEDRNSERTKEGVGMREIRWRRRLKREDEERKKKSVINIVAHKRPKSNVPIA